MRKLLVVLALVMLPGTAFAIDINKQWGLSAGIADDVGQLSLILGKPKGALVLDVNFLLISQEIEEDEPTVNPDIRQFQQVSQYSIGPRLRRFVLPGEKLTPYWDLFAHFTQTQQKSTNEIGGTGGNQTITQTGGEVGLGLGAEFETAWHFNIAVHTDFLRVEYTSLSQKSNTPGTDQELSGAAWEVVGGFNPALFARVYF